jgi:hypothetical protein
MKSIPTFLALTLTASTLLAGEQALFNGKDLAGWEGNTKLWSVEDGAITGKTSDEGEMKIEHNTFLIWKGGVLGDFELTFQYRIPAGNSGVQYRSKELPAGKSGPIISGYQADLEAGKKFSGILYEERGRGTLAERGQKTKVLTAEDGKAKVEVLGSLGNRDEIQAVIRAGDWNEYKIIAKGNHLQHFINGRQTVDVLDEGAVASKSGVLALQIHKGPAMIVQFKNIILKTDQ